MPDPNQNQQNNQVGASSQQTPSVFPQSDLPPLPPDFQNVSGTPLNATGPSDKSGSTPPSDIPPIISQPKKKFGGRRIIATILGILLLVGGVGAGLILTQQQQLFQQKAGPILTGGQKPFCDRDHQNDCAFGCTPTLSGGVCKSAPKISGSGGGTTPTNKQVACNYCSGSIEVGLVCLVSGSPPNCDHALDKCGGTKGDCTQTSTGCPSGYSAGYSSGECSGANGTLGSSSGGGLYCCKLPSTVGACSNCTLGATRACTIGGQAGTQHCVNDENCINRVNAGSWGGCIANTTTNNNNSSCQLPSVMVNGVCTAPSGNCASYQPGAGKCFVTTHIGADPSGNAVCDGPHWTTCAQGYTCSNFDCVPQTTTNNGGGGGGPTAQCSTVKAYDTNYTLLTSSQLSSLTSGTTINFCVGGTSSAGGFDKAKFTINGAAQAETTTKRSGSSDFCQNYQIPLGVTSFNVTAQIHDTTLGWSN